VSDEGEDEEDEEIESEDGGEAVPAPKRRRVEEGAPTLAETVEGLRGEVAALRRAFHRVLDQLENRVGYTEARRELRWDAQEHIRRLRASSRQ
jgi:hypothetical protein